MPKLDTKTAKSVDETESSSFEALPEQTYVGRLLSVEVKEGKEFDYWSWEFQVVEPDEYSSYKLWTNTSLSPKAAFKMKEMFDAFGVPAKTDTDLLCGQCVKLAVSQRVIESGSRKGEMGNNVERVMAYDGDDDSDGDVDDDEL